MVSISLVGTWGLVGIRTSLVLLSFLTSSLRPVRRLPNTKVRSDQVHSFCGGQGRYNDTEQGECPQLRRNFQENNVYDIPWMSSRSKHPQRLYMLEAKEVSVHLKYLKPRNIPGHGLAASSVATRTWLLKFALYWSMARATETAQKPSHELALLPRRHDIIPKSIVTARELSSLWKVHISPTFRPSSSSLISSPLKYQKGSRHAAWLVRPGVSLFKMLSVHSYVRLRLLHHQCPWIEGDGTCLFFRKTCIRSDQNFKTHRWMKRSTEVALSQNPRGTNRMIACSFSSSEPNHTRRYIRRMCCPPLVSSLFQTAFTKVCR